MLIHLLKTSFLFQNLASWIWARIPSVIAHNLEKYSALHKAFYLTGLEQLEGDYLEFGVFTGSSFVFATRIHRRLSYLGAIGTRFFGFDSFSGFGKVTEKDSHPFYLDSIFQVSAKKVRKNISRKARGCETHLIEGYFENTLKGRTALDLGIKKARIVFIDCDLLDPSALALDFILPTLQSGTVLIMDDFFSYRGNPTRGVCGAFEALNRKHPELKWRHIGDYGMGGVIFILNISHTEANPTIS